MYLPKVIQYNAKVPEAAERYADIARFIGLTGSTTAELVAALVAVLRQQRLNEQAVRIVGKGTAVADSKNGCPQRVFFCFFVIQSKTLLTQDSYDAAIEKGSCPSKSPWRK